MPLGSGISASYGRSRRLSFWLLLTLVFSTLASTAWAQPRKPKLPTKPAPQIPEKTPPSKAETAHSMTADDLGAFLDGIVPVQLEREDIAGAVIVVIKDGKIVFSKGYGYADVAQKRPIYPDRTLFRVASISKLFTWTSVMQLVEAGKLGLDRDVNDYLDFRIPPAFGKPITLRNLMTHTPGFEETVKNSAPENPQQLKPLADYLKAELPHRIYPPGTVPAYSNYGAALAGYIVQRVSGQPFEDYVDEHIFKPLGMTHATFRQPLPEPLKPLMSNGYNLASQPAKPFEVIQDEPAGSLSVAAQDISHFMIAHLQDGQFQGTQILRPETARLMHSRQFVNLPDMDAIALGFYEESRNGHRIIGHGGDLQFFHSDLHLIPDVGVGFFVSYNSQGKGDIDPRDALWPKFMDRYFPYTPPPTVQPASAAQDEVSISGRYISSRRGQTTLLKLVNVLGETKVFRNDDGTLSNSDITDLNGQPKRFREIGPMIFRNENGQDRIAFKRDDSGRWVMVIDFPAMVFQRSSVNENSGLDQPIIIGATVVLALALLFWPIGWVIRRHYGRELELTQQQRRLRLLVRIVCVVDVAFVAGWLLIFLLVRDNFSLLSDRLDPWLRLLQMLGWLGVLGVVFTIINVIRSWRNRQRWLWSKLGDTAIALACVAFVWFVFTWNLMAFSLKY
jgi:CubicO group peptidase (beta-lactamase class C family)